MAESGNIRGAVYLGYKEIGGVNLYFDTLTGGRLTDEKLVEQMVGVTIREYNKVPPINKSELTPSNVSNDTLVNSQINKY